MRQSPSSHLSVCLCLCLSLSPSLVSLDSLSLLSLSVFLASVDSQLTLDDAKRLATHMGLEVPRDGPKRHGPARMYRAVIQAVVGKATANHSTAGGVSCETYTQQCSSSASCEGRTVCMRMYRLCSLRMHGGCGVWSQSLSLFFSSFLSFSLLAPLKKVIKVVLLPALLALSLSLLPSSSSSLQPHRNTRLLSFSLLQTLLYLNNLIQSSWSYINLLFLQR